MLEMLSNKPTSVPLDTAPTGGMTFVASFYFWKAPQIRAFWANGKAVATLMNIFLGQSDMSMHLFTLLWRTLTRTSSLECVPRLVELIETSLAKCISGHIYPQGMQSIISCRFSSFLSFFLFFVFFFLVEGLKIAVL
jgi:hypothetical protein